MTWYRYKFGIYGAAGQTTCGSRAGSLYYEYGDAATYASWGVDYVKYDDCGEVRPRAPRLDVLMQRRQTFSRMRVTE